jgi:hypothetical protein
MGFKEVKKKRVLPPLPAQPDEKIITSKQKIERKKKKKNISDFMH